MLRDYILCSECKKEIEDLGEILSSLFFIIFEHYMYLEMPIIVLDDDSPTNNLFIKFAKVLEHKYLIISSEFEQKYLAFRPLEDCQLKNQHIPICLKKRLHAKSC